MHYLAFWDMMFPKQSKGIKMFQEILCYYKIQEKLSLGYNVNMFKKSAQPIFLRSNSTASYIPTSCTVQLWRYYTELLTAQYSVFSTFMNSSITLYICCLTLTQLWRNLLTWEVPRLCFSLCLPGSTSTKINVPCLLSLSSPWPKGIFLSTTKCISLYNYILIT